MGHIVINVFGDYDKWTSCFNCGINQGKFIGGMRPVTAEKGVEFSSLIDAKKKVCRVSINISYSTVQYNRF